MKTIIHIIRPPFLTLLVLVSFITETLAQEVSIPDPGLNAAIREALQIPNGPLTQRDMLNLTDLDASRRNVRSLDGLEAARNLASLNLQINDLTNFTVSTQLTNLLVLDLSLNPIADFSFLNGMTNLTDLFLEGVSITNLDLPPGLTALNNLDLDNNSLTRFDLPSSLTNLLALDLGFNSLTRLSLPGGLENLEKLFLEGNQITNLALPSDLTALSELDAHENQLSSFTLPAGLTNLIELDLFFNQLTNVSLPAGLSSLTELDLDGNKLAALNLPSNLVSLADLHLRGNQLTNFNLPADLRALNFLDVSENQLDHFDLPADLNELSFLRISSNKLSSFTIPPGLTNLSGVFLRFNQLTNLVLPADLGHLASLDVVGNQLTRLDLPQGLTNLAALILVENQLAELTLPPDMAQLTTLDLEINPLTTLVLSEPLAATNLAGTVASLQNQGVSVFTYPLTVQLVQPRTLVGAFQFGITGPPGVYTVLGSKDLVAWSVVGTASNTLGSVAFTDVTAQFSPHKFYRALLQNPPTNMVFVPPGTFNLGTPTNEVNRQADEGPQTTVTISHGFWMGKYEVTQGEYQAVIGSNPSGFPGDLNRPVESVSWLDATNYCARLTQQELTAGHIPPGSHFRLPTEAELEYAARAGTTTRFSYGDDPNFTNLINHAWYAANSGFGTHPVGQKAPNPWGLFDLEGNVWEWCQDWYGPYPGGSVTDPQGPASSALDVKVIRGGAWDAFAEDCRSGRRLTEGVSPFITDFILGFRVVLVTDSL